MILSFAKRFPYARLGLLLLAGLMTAPLTASMERSLEAGRQYLLREQRPDGAWPDREQPVAATSLALLALLAGDTGTPPVPEAIHRGVDWLLDQQRSNGQIGNNLVEHATATVALAQRLLIGPPPQDAERLHEALTQAAAFVADAQRIRKNRDADLGGWHFQPTFPRSDLYYSGWQILALQAARQAGVEVDPVIYEEALKFVIRSRQREGYGAQPAFSEPSSRAYRSHTGVALLAGRLLADNPAELEEDTVLAWLDAVPPTWGGAQYRGHFFGMIFFQSQAYRHRGDQAWTTYRERLYPLFLRNQRGDGQWEAPESSEETSEGTVISTALGILVLAVDEQRLPLFWPRDIATGLSKFN